MISVEQFHPVFAKKCHELTEGQSAYSRRDDIPYDLHCYRDGWHVYWKNPPDGQIGRRLRTWKHLLLFLHGDWRIGTVIPTEDISKAMEEISPVKRG